MNYRLWVLGTAVAGLLGCAHSQQQTRLQSGDEAEREKEVKEAQVKTIGDMTAFGNAEPIPVSGVGIVYGLEGTGGDPPAGSYRTMLEDQLQKQGYKNVKEIMASPDTSLVLVSGQIPAGSHEGDAFDIDIALPPQSKTTSLRGGYLKECYLYNYDSAKHLDPKFEGANKMFLGHQLGRAEGPLLVGFGEGDEASKLKQGRIWGAGRCKAGVNRPFYLIFNNDAQRAAVVQKAAERINETFHGSYQGSGGDLAIAKTKTYLELRVPPQYRHNLARYLRVVRLIPLYGAPAAGSSYRKWIEKDLMDPAHTVTAALRMEALGNESIPVLKRGLTSTHPIVRFARAESLAYLGDPGCAEELARLAEHQPLLRAYALTAMASLDEAICHVKLRELLASSSAETRYGAFRALCVLDEHDSAVPGELLNGSFWLRRAAPDSAGLVHVSTGKRAEIVLFGEEANLVPPFSFLAGEFTITAARDDERCTLCRLSVAHGNHRRQCSLKLEDVLHNMADMGGMYPEAVELVRQAGNYQSLNCPVAVDALPQAVTVERLAKDGGRDADAAQADQEIINARSDFGATPTLYDSTSGRRAGSRSAAQ